MYPAVTGLHIWHGLGHSPNLDAPAQFAEVLSPFTDMGNPAQLHPRVESQAKAHDALTIL